MSDSEPLPLDRVRAYVEGTLPPADREAFASEFAADRELAGAVAMYGVLHAATAGSSPVPPCALTADDLVLDDAPTAPFWSRVLASRRIAAAAAILLAAGAGIAWYATRPSSAPSAPTPSEVVFDSIPLSNPGLASSVPAIPEATLAGLSNYEPAVGGRLAFLEDLDQARAIAAATERPLLVFIYHPTCPWCQSMAKGAFKDAGVVAAAEPFVLVKLDVTKIDQSLASGFEFWPIFWVEDSKGTRKHSFGGEQSAASLARELAAGASAAALPAGTAGPIAWPVAREAARALSDAPPKPAVKFAALEAARAANPKSPLGAYAAATLDLQRAYAFGVIEDVRSETARGGASAGVADLDAWLPRWKGTPIGRDLEAVRAALVRDGVFPRLSVKKADAPKSPK